MKLAEDLHLLNENSRLSNELELFNFQEVENFADYCELSKTQALIFASCLMMGYSGISMFKVFKHFGLQKHEIIAYRKDIETLFRKKLILREKTTNKRSLRFFVSDSIYDMVNSGESLFERETVSPPDLYDFLYAYNDLKTECMFNSNSKETFREEFEVLVQENSVLSIFKKIKTEKLSLFETYLFIETLSNAHVADYAHHLTHLEESANYFYASKRRAEEQIDKIILDLSPLTKSNFITVLGKNSSNCELRIADRIIHFLREQEGFTIRRPKANSDNRLILHNSIPEKELYFNKNTAEQLKEFNKILKEKAFSRLQTRMGLKKQPTGLTAILYGEPGTGKTETVLQAAKSSGRNIFKVDIAEVRTKWYGETERLVKKIFSDYYQIKRAEKLCPILLFNEADAIIGKRKSANTDSSVSRTENTIQNILLEELEKFDGILIATTNLVENIDSAFERRFLFKVRFEKPSVEISAKIWKQKISYLSTDEAMELARNYSLSGGEIDNIVFKNLIAEIIEDKELSFLEIRELCAKEKWNSRSQTKIGFQIT